MIAAISETALLDLKAPPVPEKDRHVITRRRPVAQTQQTSDDVPPPPYTPQAPIAGPSNWHSSSRAVVAPPLPPRRPATSLPTTPAPRRPVAQLPAPTAPAPHFRQTSAAVVHARPQRPPIQVPAAPAVVAPSPALLRFRSAQTVNHYELFSKSEALTATYIVDPCLDAAELRMPKSLRKQREAVWGKGSKKAATLNASYRTRSAAIDLNLAVLSPRNTPSSPSGSKVPARILVSTKSGRMNLHFHEVQHQTRSLDLHVEASSGKVVLFLPPTFDGPLVFLTRDGCKSVTFLPAFAARTRTIRTTERETVVLCDSGLARAHSPSSSPSPSSPSKKGKGKRRDTDADADHGDRALIKTGNAKVIVGFSGLDVLEEPKRAPGLLGALGRLVGVGAEKRAMPTPGPRGGIALA